MRRAQRAQCSATETSVSEQQAASTWCNPTSAIVRNPRDNVWVGDRPCASLTLMCEYVRMLRSGTKSFQTLCACTRWTFA